LTTLLLGLPAPGRTPAGTPEGTLGAASPATAAARTRRTAARASARRSARTAGSAATARATRARSPAATQTDIIAQMSQQHIDYMLSKIPLARFVDVQEIAALACWLATEDCSCSTGAVFDITGGRATY